MSTPPHFDLQSMLNLQKQYAIDLSYTAIGVDNSNAMSDLNSKLNTLYNADSGSQLASNSVLYKQELINDILTTEANRLDQKKHNIDSAVTGQQRMIEINDSYQKRYAAYTKMAIAFIVGLVLYIFMNRLMILLPFIPEIIFYILIIIIMGCIIIYMFLLYIDIQRRNVINFDEILVTTPNVVVSTSPSSSGDDDVFSGPAPAPAPPLCVGQECCSSTQTWSASANQCK